MKDILRKMPIMTARSPAPARLPQSRPRHGMRRLPEGHPELKKHRLDFPAAPANARLFARAVGPHLLELAPATGTAPEEDAVRRQLALE